jgi:hypothetical protein
MTMSKVACPHCRAVLKSKKFLLGGQEIRCPSCQRPFKLPGEVPVAVGVAAGPAPRPMQEQSVSAVSAVPPAFFGASERGVNGGGPSVELSTPSSRALAILLAALGCVLVLGLGAGLVYVCLIGDAKLAENDLAQGPDNNPARKLQPVIRPLIELSKAEQDKVDLMTSKGVEFLKKSQRSDGTWDGPFADSFAALVGLTLLESGVPAKDPVVQKAAAYARIKLSTLATQPHPHQTYTLALTFLFFDKLNDAADRENLKKIAMRLVAGQTPQGGWSYQVPILSDPQAQELAELLRAMGRTPPEEFRKANAGRFQKASAVVAGLGLFQSRKAMAANDYRAGGDNSNTQFALLAMWAARRHNLPVDPSLELVVRRFRNIQNTDGSFNYSGFGNNPSQLPTMTCAGLLGLAVGYGLDSQETRNAKSPQGDAAIQNGLKHLSQFIGQAPKDPKHRPPETELYFLWSLERVAVLYQLAKIHDKEWYSWGMSILLAYQHPNGSWHLQRGHGSDRIVDTCFALLFLQRVNLAKDLTDKLTEMAEEPTIQPGDAPPRKE